MAAAVQHTVNILLVTDNTIIAAGQTTAAASRVVADVQRRVDGAREAVGVGDDAGFGAGSNSVVGTDRFAVE